MLHRILTADQLGELLQSARKASHFTQAQLASQMALSQSRLSKIEQRPGSATVQKLLNMCGALGLDLMMAPSRSTAPASLDINAAADFQKA